MTTLVSLDNQVHWTPPATRPQKKPWGTMPLQPRRQEPCNAATATSTQCGLTADDVVIELSSNNEDSDTDAAEDGAYVALVASTQRARTNSTGNAAQVPGKNESTESQAGQLGQPGQPAVMTRPPLASSSGGSVDALSSLIRRVPLTTAPSSKDESRDEADDDADDDDDNDELPSIREIIASLSSKEHTRTKSAESSAQLLERAGSTEGPGSRPGPPTMTPRPSLPCSSGGSATVSSTLVGPIPLVTALSDEYKPGEHQDAAASYRSQQRRSPGNGSLGQPGSVYRCDIEATDNDGRVCAGAERSPIIKTTEPAAAEPGTPDAVQGSSSRSQSEDNVARDTNATVLSQADGESADNNSRGIDDPATALFSIDAGRRTDPLHNPRIPPRKRASVGEGGSSQDEYVPGRKRRRAAAPVGRKRSTQRSLGHPQRPRRVSKQRLGRSTDQPPVSEEQPAMDPIGASYEEWPLPDATLKCVREDSTATFQLQFTWPTICAKHSPQDQEQDRPATDHLQPRRTARSRRRSAQPIICAKHSPQDQDRPATEHLQPRRKFQGRRQLTGEKMQETPIESGSGQTSYQDSQPEGYPVERLLARWRRNLFLLRWGRVTTEESGTTDWVRREDIDPQMVRDFESRYRGFDEGIDVLESRVRTGRRQYHLHWHDRPSVEDRWVDEKLMNPNFIDRA